MESDQLVVAVCLTLQLMLIAVEKCGGANAVVVAKKAKFILTQESESVANSLTHLSRCESLASERTLGIDEDTHGFPIF